MKIKLFKNNIFKIKNDSKLIYNFLCNNLKNSIFNSLGYTFFLQFLKINHKNIFYIKHNSSIVSYVAYINSNIENKLKFLILKYVVKKPFFLILLIFKNINFFFKFHIAPKSYIQLIHLIINHKKFNNKISKKQIHSDLENLHKKIIILNKAKGIYALYHKQNIHAHNYYKKNNYILHSSNLFFNLVKKRIK